MTEKYKYKGEFNIELQSCFVAIVGNSSRNVDHSFAYAYKTAKKHKTAWNVHFLWNECFSGVLYETTVCKYCTITHHEFNFFLNICCQMGIWFFFRIFKTNIFALVHKRLQLKMYGS